MFDTKEYILNKWELKISSSRNIEIPNVTRADLARLFGELGFKVGAEIGVEVGKYSEMMFNSNPGVKIYLVDPWNEYDGYYEFGNQDNFNTMYNYAMLRTSDCQGRFSESTPASSTLSSSHSPGFSRAGNQSRGCISKCPGTRAHQKPRPAD